MEAVAVAAVLKGLASVAEMGERKGETPLPENATSCPLWNTGMTAARSRVSPLHEGDMKCYP